MIVTVSENKKEVLTTSFFCDPVGIQTQDLQNRNLKAKICNSLIVNALFVRRCFWGKLWVSFSRFHCRRAAALKSPTALRPWGWCARRRRAACVKQRTYSSLPISRHGGGRAAAQRRLAFNFGDYIPGLIVWCQPRGVCGQRGRRARPLAAAALPS